MWVRKRLDIRWSDLGSALRDCLTRWDRAALADDLEDLWSASGDAMPCLSVRTGFDLWLTALALPTGSEVLVSAVTIRDMVKIIEHHRLVPVPIDVNPDDLSLDLDNMRRAISSKTRVVLVAHLFGTRQPLEPLFEIARQGNLLVAEDCAQAFAGRHFTGHAESDISMFSFGTIKTATALGGAMLRVRNPGIRRRMLKVQASYPVQRRGSYAKRVFKYGLMKLMSYGPTYGGLVAIMQLAGRDPDRLVTSAVRGFPGPKLVAMLRRQPSAPLMALMYRRIGFYHRRSLVRRTERGRRLLMLLHERVRSPGARAPFHNFWVFPVLHRDPTRFVSKLLAAGFDASRAHSLTVVQPPADRPELKAVKAEELLPQIVHLPCYAEMPDRELRRMAEQVHGLLRHRSAAASPETIPGFVSTAS